MKIEIDKTGGWARTLRAHHGLTQAEMASRTGLDRITIWRIENGKALPDLETIKRMADATGGRLVIETSRRLAELSE